MTSIDNLKRRLRPQRGTGPRVYGKAGASARAHGAGLRARLADTVSFRHSATGAAVVALFVGALTYSNANDTGRAILAAAIVAAIWVAAELTIRRPAVAMSMLLLGVYAVAALYAAPLYAVSRSPIFDPTSAHLFLLLLGVLIVLAAHRFTRTGRAWVTTLLALGAVLVVGPLIIVVYGPAGYTAAYVAAGAVILWRAGARDWAAEKWDRAAEKWEAHKRGPMPQTAESVDRWEKGASGEEATAELLTSLDNAWTVFHDLAVPGTNANIDHLVIGPGGVFVIDSKQYSGKVTEHAENGLQVGSTPLAQTLHTALWEAREAARVLGLDDTQVSTLVAIHGATLPRDRSRVMIFDAERDLDDPVGDVTVLAPDALLAEIAGLGVAVLSDREVKRLVGRARRRFEEATSQRRGPVDPARESALPRTAAAMAAVVDGDGNVTKPSASFPASTVVDDGEDYVTDDVVDVDAGTAQIGPGTPVAIRSNGQEFTGYVAVTEPRDEPQYGLVVWAVPQAEFVTAARESRPAKSQPYLADQVRPDLTSEERPS